MKTTKTKSKYVMSEKLYTPQTYCEKMIGCCYGFDHEDAVHEIETVLKRHGLESDHWSYPLDEIEHIVENDINVVLVDVSGFDKHGKWKMEYRWFEVSEDFKEEDDEQ